MRITEGRLRSIIRSVIRENFEDETDTSSTTVSEEAKNAFNEAYVDIMLKTGSDHADIHKDTVQEYDYYTIILSSLTNNYDSYKRETIVEALGEIKCPQPLDSEFWDYAKDRIHNNGEQWDPDWETLWYSEWFKNNASKIIECLSSAVTEKRKKFFGLINSARVASR